MESFEQFVEGAKASVQDIARTRIRTAKDDFVPMLITDEAMIALPDAFEDKRHFDVTFPMLVARLRPLRAAWVFSAWIHKGVDSYEKMARRYGTSMANWPPDERGEIVNVQCFDRERMAEFMWTAEMRRRPGGLQLGPWERIDDSEHRWSFVAAWRLLDEIARGVGFADLLSTPRVPLDSPFPPGVGRIEVVE